MKKKTIRDIDVYDKKVLLRVDFNVPVVSNKITDDTRIVEALPTINFLLEKGARLILMSHMGRPEGKVDKRYSLRIVFEKLKELLPNVKIIMAKDTIGEDATAKVGKLKQGEILLLENLRFSPDEEENKESFCKKLAKFGDIYVNDAFGTAHRKHASTYGVAKLLPNAIGFLIEKELKIICGAIENPKRPFVAILGGAKVEDKIGIVNSLINCCDSIVIGGGMAYTFLKAQGYKIGKSLFDEERLEEVKSMISTAKEKNVNIVLPIDSIITKNLDDLKNVKTTKDANVPDDFMGVDIGPKTCKLFTKYIKKAKTIIWNGPMGVFEKKQFAVGTFKVAKAISKVKGTTIVGGGDSASAIVSMGFEKKVTHISTGGGASLKLFEGKVLPGVDVIENI